MSIALRGTATGSTGTTPRTVNLPSGTIQGDTLYLEVAMALDAAVVTVPAGFTLVTGAEVTGLTNKVQIYSKVAGASEPSSYSVSWTGGGNGQVGLVSLTSDFTLVSDGINTANSAVANTSKTWNSVSPAATNAFLMCFGVFVNAASTPDAAMTERWDVTSLSIQIYLMTQQLSASGATGTRTATGSSTTTQRTITLAVSESGFANQARITNAGVYVETNNPAAVDITNVGLYVSARGDDDAPYISAHVNNSRFIDLIWVDNGLAGDTYELQTSPDNATWTTITDTVERTNYTYSHRYLQPLTAYYYRVRRVLGGVNGAWSSSVLATTNNPLAIRAAVNQNVTATSPIVLNKPTGTVTGDLILAQYSNTVDAAPSVVPSGFTLLTSSVVTGIPNQRIYYKVATASEPTTYSWSFASGTGGVCMLTVYSDTGIPVEVDDSNGQTNASSTSHTFPSVTADHIATLLMTFGVSTFNTATPPTGETELNDNGSNPRLSVNYELISAIGATGTKTGATSGAVAFAASSVLAAETFYGTVPTAPSALSATAYNDVQINLSWTDNSSDENGFAIYRSSTASPVYTLIGSTIANVTTYTDTGLTPGTQYNYKVAAFNGGGLSTYSSVSSATTVAIQIRVISSIIEVPATASYNVSVPVGIIEHDLMIMAIYYPVGTITMPSGWASIVDYGAGFGRLVLLGKYASASEPSSYTITFGSLSTIAVGIIAFYSSTGAPVIYESLGTNYISTGNTNHPSAAITTTKESIIAYFGTNEGVVSVAPDPLMIERWDTNSYQSSYLQTQAIKVTGSLGTRTSTAAAAYKASIVTLAIIESGSVSPTAPSGLTATVYDDTQINLAWTDNSSDEAYFEIWRGIGASPTYTLLNTVYTNITSYADTGLTPLTQYSYKVRAVNGGGASSYTSVATATTPSVIIFRNTSSSTASGTTTSPFTVTLPTGIVVGDLMLMQITYSGNTAVFTTPSGWTLVNSIAATSTTIGVIIYSKIVGISEPSTFSLTWTNSATISVDIIAWYSYQGSAIVVDDSATSAPAASTNRVFPSVNVSAIPSQMNMFATTVGSTTPAATSIERWDHNVFVPAYLMTEKINTIGATGTRTATGPSNLNRMITVAIKEVPSAPPNAPSALSATAISTSQINLSWADNSSDETSFSIERSLTGVGSWSVINSPVPNTTTYSDTGLSTNTTYYYRIQAINFAGGSSYSTANATTLDTAPTAPSGLSATAITSSRIDLAWTDNSGNETSFEIERSPNGSTGWTVINTTAANAVSYSNTGLSSNTQYYYRVRAHNSGGYSSYTSTANATTLDTIPTAPSGLTATTISSSRIDLSWTDNSSNELDFSVERSLNGTTGWTVINTTAANATSYSNTGLNYNTTYYYRVRAHNAIGNSAYTSVANATTLNVAPAAPTVLIATVISYSEIDLTWTDNSDNETSFRIDRSLDGVSWTIDYATVSPNVVSYHDTGLSELTQYYYRVRAHNAIGDSAYSNTVNGTTPISPPDAPSTLTATTISDVYIKLEWLENADNEAHIIVERSLTGVGSWTQIASLPPNSDTYISNNLTGSTTYYYRVKATNAGGSSAYSNIDSATTLPGRIYYKFSNVAQTTTLPS